MTHKKPSDTEQLYLRLLQYVKPHWKAFAVAVFCMVGTAATEPVFPAIMKRLLDDGFNARDTYLVWAIPVGIVMLFVLRSIFVYVSGYLMMWVSSRVVTDLRRAGIASGDFKNLPQDLLGSLFMAPISYLLKAELKGRKWTDAELDAAADSVLAGWVK